MLDPSLNVRTGPAQTQLGTQIAVNNRQWLVIAILAVCLIGSTAAWVFSEYRHRNQKPLVISTDGFGRPIATSYDKHLFRPDDTALRIAIAKFFELHYRRVRRTIPDDWPNSLLFLDNSAKAQVRNANVEDAIVAFQSDPSKDEVEVVVNNVILGNTDSDPFTATVDYHLRYLETGLRERKREHWTGQIDFGFVAEQSLDQMMVNLPGIAISRLTVTQAFTN